MRPPTSCRMTHLLHPLGPKPITSWFIRSLGHSKLREHGGRRQGHEACWNCVVHGVNSDAAGSSTLVPDRREPARNTETREVRGAAL